MPSVKFSALVSGMKGVANGSVFSQWHGQYYYRNRSSGGKRSSSKWQLSKANMAQVAQGWRALTVPQKAAWAAIVGSYPTTDKYGTARNPTAYELYCRLNASLLNAGQTLLVTPIAPLAITNLISLTVTGLTTTPLTATTGAAWTANERVILYASKPMTTGQSYNRGKLTKMLVKTYAGSNAIAFNTEWVALFGDKVAGTRIWCMAQVIRIQTGQITGTYTGYVDVA